MGGPTSYPGVVPPPPVPAGYARPPADDTTPAIPFADIQHQARVQRTRQAITSRLDKQMAAAEKADDFDLISHIAAQYGALDNGGFAGLRRYNDERADVQSQRAHLAHQDNPLASMSPDDLWIQTVARGGDANVADAAAQRRRISLAEAQAKASGGPIKFSPADAQGMLEARYPEVADLFAANEKGGAKLGDLSNIHAELVKRGLPGLDDPNTMMNQAIKVRVKQLYGDRLPAQVDEPFSPEQFVGATGGLGMAHAAALLGNVFTGRGLHMTQGYHDNQLATGEWWKTINQTPTP